MSAASQMLEPDRRRSLHPPRHARSHRPPADDGRVRRVRWPTTDGRQAGAAGRAAARLARVRRELGQLLERRDQLSHARARADVPELHAVQGLAGRAVQREHGLGRNDATRSITAIGKVADNPAATYVGFHQGDKIAAGVGDDARLPLDADSVCRVPRPQVHRHAAGDVSSRRGVLRPRAGQAALERFEPDRRFAASRPASTRWKAARKR